MRLSFFTGCLLDRPGVQNTPNSMSSSTTDRGTPSSQAMMGMVISL
jgi:hypothetical protein